MAPLSSSSSLPSVLEVTYKVFLMGLPVSTLVYSSHRARKILKQNKVTPPFQLKAPQELPITLKILLPYSCVQGLE